jgi:hypothetical protein
VITLYSSVGTALAAVVHGLQYSSGHAGRHGLSAQVNAALTSKEMISSHDSVMILLDSIERWHTCWHIRKNTAFFLSFIKPLYTVQELFLVVAGPGPPSNVKWRGFSRHPSWGQGWGGFLFCCTLGTPLHSCCLPYHERGLPPVPDTLC